MYWNKASVNMSPSIGILGGGQLGKMLAQAAMQLTSVPHISIYDPNFHSCAKEISNSFTCGSFSNGKAIMKFAQEVDIITYEFENIPVSVVEPLHNAIQGSKALQILQHRIKEKEFINSLPGIQCVPYKEVTDGFTYDFPYIVKSTTLGYDGKGQHLIQSESDLHHVEIGMTAESYLHPITEYSLIIARNINGEITHYPPLLNEHVNQILESSTFAHIDKDLEEMMFIKAKQIAVDLNYYGVLTVEFFLHNRQLYVNEVAPRVHNSGHITLDAANVSQFDLHLYSLLGLKYPNIEIDSSWCMVNVLGQHYKGIKTHPPVGKFYDYGKNSIQHNRKVGHINGLLKDITLIKEARNR